MTHVNIIHCIIHEISIGVCIVTRKCTGMICGLQVQLCGALFHANCNWSSLEQCTLGTYRTNCTRAVAGSASPQLLIYIHVHTTTQSTENPTSSHIYIYACTCTGIHGTCREKLPSFHPHIHIHVHDTSLLHR